MKTYWRLLGFAKPIEKYAIPYFFYTLLYAFFNTFNLVMIIPILNILFNTGEVVAPVTQLPPFSVSANYLTDVLNYMLYSTYGGANYDVMQVLLLLAGILVCSALLSNLFRYLGQRTVRNMEIHTLQTIRNRAFDNVMGLDVGFFTNERKGDILSRISSDVQVIQFCISNTLQVVFRDPFLVIAYMFVLVNISWQLTIFSVLYLPVVAFAIGYMVKKLKTKATAGQQTFGEMVSTLDESLTGVKIIKGYNATDYVRNKFHKINDLYSRIMKSMARRQQLSSPASEFLGITALSVLLLFGGKLVVDGGLGGSEFVAYLAIFSQITRPLRSFADAFVNINQGIAAGERVLEFIDARSEINDKPDAAEMTDFTTGIEFRNVSFSYGNKKVLRDISFTIRKGETIALVGASGGGKTTLSDLIPRFYDVQEGEVLIDGRDIRDYSMESLRSHMGIVAQETILFNDSIENNIKLSKPNATRQEIEEAARIANADKFIMDTEEGYDTNIGDRGMKLSGGQRQRLSIARAVLKNPDILILDEATSALDTESEKLVQDALNSLLKGRTSVVIAHRLSTIHNADRILVVERGRIIEEGTHDELMQRSGTYSKLVAMQHMS
jgi:subfamily B ATP-binding cassette protein MsbA